MAIYKRKELRKQKRKEKKAKRNEYYMRNHLKKPSNLNINNEQINNSQKHQNGEQKDKTKNKKAGKLNGNTQVTNIQKNKKERKYVPTDRMEEDWMKTQRELSKLKKEMNKQKKRQLLEEINEEDRNIKQLEKKLKLNKRKSKAIPFTEDGLDYILEMCNSDTIKSAVANEQVINNLNNNFNDDLTLMTSTEENMVGNLNVKKSSKVETGQKQKKILSDKNSQTEDKQKRKKLINKKLNNKTELLFSSEDDLVDDLLSDENEFFDLELDESETELSTKKFNQKKDTKNKKTIPKVADKKTKMSSSSSSGSEDDYDESYSDEDQFFNLELDKSEAEKTSQIVPVKKQKSVSHNKKSKNDISEDKQRQNKSMNNKRNKSKLTSTSGSEFEDNDESFSGEDDFFSLELDESENELNAKHSSKTKTVQKQENTSNKRNSKNKEGKKSEIKKLEEELSSNDSLNSELTDNETEELENDTEDGMWEDIYGRMRAQDGTVINKNEGKYIPPSIRAKLEGNTPEDQSRIEKLMRLKKLLKGLLNRLAERNMHNITTQIENLYMNNSRNDMNETLTSLMMESLVSETSTPERLIIEHIVLIIVLHANVGTEVGAHFLQTIIKKFDEFINANHDVENKNMDNIINVVSQLYNFKLFDHKLLYEILYKLSNNFEEKDVECILHILKSVGFTLRKEKPLALRDFILDIQKRAASSSVDVKENPRVKFMLDILLAIKNNNVTKIPNYDTSYSEHMKKMIKQLIRKGNYVTQLNISLEDLLKAEERGRWWVVGSAWTGNTTQNSENVEQPAKTDKYSEKLLQFAKRQKMNTDARRNIFCILYSTGDHLDTFEKLLRLNLKNTQEREIMNVILHCSLLENPYNPVYAALLQKFCDYDRKYQMNIKCAMWDKLKLLHKLSERKQSSLAKVLTHLIIEKGIPISTLKVVHFTELDKITLHLIKEILKEILIHEDTEACLSVFKNVGLSDKLKMFRESLRLFISFFLLRNLKSESNMSEEERSLLESRAKTVQKILTGKAYNF